MLVPKFINKLVDRLTQSVPMRFRRMVRLAIFAATIAFVAFELSRLAAAATFLLPIWTVQANRISDMAHQEPIVAAISLTATAIAFVAPMAGLYLVIRRFRNGAACTKRVTKPAE